MITYIFAFCLAFAPADAYAQEVAIDLALKGPEGTEPVTLFEDGNYSAKGCTGVIAPAPDERRKYKASSRYAAGNWTIGVYLVPQMDNGEHLGDAYLVVAAHEPEA